MRARRLVAGCIVGAVVLAVTTSLAAMADGGDEELRKVVRQLNASSNFEQKLKHIMGKYDHQVKWWSGPGASPQEFTFRGETEWTLDNRFMIQRIQGRWMNSRVEGMIVLSYDRVAEQYSGIWMDTIGNRTMVSRGTLDESGDTITLHGEYFDVLTREPVKVRSVFEVPSRRKLPRIEMFRTAGEAEEYKFLEVATKKRLEAAG